MKPSLIVTLTALLILSFLSGPACTRAADPPDASPPPVPDGPGPDPLAQAIAEYQTLLGQRISTGADVSQAMDLNSRSIEAHRNGDFQGALMYLNEAIAFLRGPDSGDAFIPPPSMGPPPGVAGGDAALPKLAEMDPDAHLTAPLSLRYDKSPFALHGPYILDKTTRFSAHDITGFILDIHARSVRIIAPELFSLTDELNSLVEQGVLLYVDVGFENPDKLRDLVAANIGSIRYWRVINEPDAPYGFMYRPLDYLEILKRTYTTIKSVDPEALISIGGLADGRNVLPTSQGPVFLKTILDNGGGDYFDIFAFHFQAAEDEYGKLKHSVSFYREMLAGYGYDKPIWITEFGTYDGNPPPHAGGPMKAVRQSEADQAAGMIKLYVTGLSLGVEKMFWSLIVERHRFGGEKNSYFDNIGLINNPCNDYDDAGGCRDSAAKKLTYHTFRFMVETLEGSDWNQVETIRDSGGTHVYRFPPRQPGPPVWVAWSDAPGGATVFLEADSNQPMVVIDAVPNAESGARVVDPKKAFTRATISPEAGGLPLTLNRMPVYVTAGRAD